MKVKHLGIIPDGNRRWAREHGVSNAIGYDYFSNHICEIIKSVNDYGIEMVTFYVVSKENLKRANEDVIDILNTVNTMLLKKMPNLANDLNIVVRCVGINSIEDEDIKFSAEKIETFSKNNTGMIVNLLVGYNPFDEINEVILNGNNIDITHLSVPKYVDVVIRTAGGPTRLSNFLPLQCGYANVEIVETKFIDTTCDTIVNILERYKGIVPNYGK